MNQGNVTAVWVLPCRSENSILEKKHSLDMLLSGHKQVLQMSKPSAQFAGQRTKY